MKLRAAILAVTLFAATAHGQTTISTFPYFYDWTNPASFTKQPDGRTMLGGGDGYWGSYSTGNPPQFAVDATLGLVKSNLKDTYDTLFVRVDATGRTFNGSEVFTFDASRSGTPGTSGTLYVCANGTAIRTIDVATELVPTMRSFTTFLPTALGNSLFTVSIVVLTNSSVSVDNTGFSGGALPITLGSFDLSATGGAIVLTWKTLTETDNYGFFVQKSDDQKEWVDISSSFQPGYGTTISPHSYSFSDTSKPFGKYYRLRQMDLDGTNHYSFAVAYAGTGNEPAGAGFALNQCYPNPFNPTTTISFRLSKEGHAALIVYNTIGQEVATLVNEVVPAGYHSVVWDPTEKSSGTFFYVLRAEGKVEVRKMLYVK